MATRFGVSLSGDIGLRASSLLSRVVWGAVSEDDSEYLASVLDGTA